MLNIDLNPNGIAVIRDLDQVLQDEAVPSNSYLITDGMFILKDDGKVCYMVPLCNINRVIITE